MLFRSPNENFIPQWDKAIVLQLKEKFGIKNINQLFDSKYYEQITKIRQKWIEEAQKWGLKKWKSEVTKALKDKGLGSAAITAKLRAATTKYKELQLKF